ncbi:MAG: MATE family efflux transporter [Pirellulales bacterium]|nr:MATE family efflux transporter [Pirellulales bacterium]
MPFSRVPVSFPLRSECCLTPQVDQGGSSFRPMLRLALPVLGEQFLYMLVAFSDLVLAGQFLGEQELAAMNLASYMLWLLQNLFVVVSIGATALVARLTGAGERELASQTTNQAVLLGGVMVVVLTVALWLGEGQLAAWMQLDGEPGRLARRYVWFLLPVLGAMMFESVGIACFRGAGDTATGLWIMLVVNLINVAIGWSLVRGAGPLPALGWDALALGTALGHGVGGLVVAALLVRGRSGLRLRLNEMRPDRRLIRRLLRVGLPGGLDVMSVIACQLWFVSLINRLGVLAAAAHGVAIRIESLAYLPGYAFQVSATTLAGQRLGAGDPRGALRGVLMSLATGGAVMVSGAVMFSLFPAALARIFVRDAESQVITTAVPLLRIVAVAMPALAVQMILTGALRGAGDTRWPWVFTLIGYLGVRIPLTYWLTTGLDWGVVGAWYAMAADLFCRGALVALRFLQGGWQRVRV